MKRRGTKIVVKAAGTIQKVAKGSEKTKQKLLLKLPVQQYRKCHQSCRYNCHLTKTAGNTTQNQSPKTPTNNTDTVIKAARKKTNKQSPKPLVHRNHHQSSRKNNRESATKAAGPTIQKPLPKPLDQQYRNGHQSHWHNHTETVIRAARTTQKQLPKLPERYRNCHKSHRKNNTETVAKAVGTSTEIIAKAVGPTIQKLSPKPPEKQHRYGCQRRWQNNTENVAKAVRTTIQKPSQKLLV